MFGVTRCTDRRGVKIGSYAALTLVLAGVCRFGVAGNGSINEQQCNCHDPRPLCSGRGFNAFLYGWPSADHALDASHYMSKKAYSRTLNSGHRDPFCPCSP